MREFSRARWRRCMRASGGVPCNCVVADSENRWRRLRRMGGGSDENTHLCFSIAVVGDVVEDTSGAASFFGRFHCSQGPWTHFRLRRLRLVDPLVGKARFLLNGLYCVVVVAEAPPKCAQ